MVPHVRVPSHITALYIFTVVNVTLLLNITLVEANLSVLDQTNHTVDQFDDAGAKFGPPFPAHGLRGLLVQVVPTDACREIHPPPKNNASEVTWVALIKRHPCNFDIKVWNAQRAGYAAAIIYNTQKDDRLAPMRGGDKADLINIPSGLIDYASGERLKKEYMNHTIYSVLIDREPEMNANLYLLPFAIVVGICFILMLVFMIAKWLHDLRRKRRSRISKEHLKKIPVKKFKKGDEYEMCAICLDEYEDGDKLRVLPCAHAYHMKCVDPWLTKSKRLCPLCKKKVIPGDVDDSSSEEESEDETDRQSETTPLLSAASGEMGRRRRADSFEQSGLPRVLRGNIQRVPDSFSDSSSDDGSPPASFYQSSVEVHEPRHPQGHGNIQSYGATASIAFTDEISDADDATYLSRAGYANLDGNDANSARSSPQEDPKFLIENLEGLEGAVGGISIDNTGLNMVEDHYCMGGATDPGPGVHGQVEQDPFLTRSDSSSGGLEEPEVTVRGAGSSQTSRKSKRRPQNGMV